MDGVLTKTDILIDKGEEMKKIVGIFSLLIISLITFCSCGETKNLHRNNIQHIRILLYGARMKQSIGKNVPVEQKQKKTLILLENGK